MSYTAENKIAEAIRILKDCRGEVIEHRSLLDDVINEVADLMLSVSDELWRRERD